MDPLVLALRARFKSIDVAILYLIHWCVNLCGRSQRDTAGEREKRAKRLEECQKMVARLDGDIATADNDRRQFDAEVKRRQTQRNEIA